MGDFSIPLLGMSRACADLNQAAARIARAPLSASDPLADQIDLSFEIVALLQARDAFRANAKLAQTVDENTRTFLDLLP